MKMKTDSITDKNEIIICEGNPDYQYKCKSLAELRVFLKDGKTECYCDQCFNILCRKFGNSIARIEHIFQKSEKELLREEWITKALEEFDHPYIIVDLKKEISEYIRQRDLWFNEAFKLNKYTDFLIGEYYYIKNKLSKIQELYERVKKYETTDALDDVHNFDYLLSRLKEILEDKNVGL